MNQVYSPSQKMQKKSIDTSLVFLILGLVIFWMIMISSVSVYSSFKVTSKMFADGKIEEANNYFYLLRNMIHVWMGLFAVVIISKIDYTFFERYAKRIFWTTLLFLFIVLFIGSKYNGARWWIDIPWVPFSLQPVEFVKIWLILVLAYFMKKKRSELSDLYNGFIPFFSIVWVVFLLLVFQPDFWSILIIAPITIAMYYIWWGNIRYIFISFLICLVWASTIYGIGKLWGENGNVLSYISKRIDNFFRDGKEIVEKSNPDGKDYQIKQWLLAIGSGGFFGLGFGKSIQKFWYLPEVQWDFIFSVIVEELWFLWAMFLFWIYLWIAFRGFTIARSTKDVFWRYTAFGITMLIITQAFINIWVNLNIVPLTWVTLPFVSYGWSSLFSLMISVWILLSISRHMEYKPENLIDALSAKRKVVL